MSHLLSIHRHQVTQFVSFLPVVSLAFAQTAPATLCRPFPLTPPASSGISGRSSALFVNKSNRCTHTMSSLKIKRKHFDNPFPDYSDQAALDVLVGTEIHENYVVRKCLDRKWESATTKINKYIEKFKKDASIYTGTAGIAMLYLQKDAKNAEYLKLAKEYTQTSSIPSKRRFTFLCGDTGAMALRAVVCHQTGDTTEMKSIVKNLISLGTDAANSKADLANEYLYGRAGYLFALLFVNKHISPAPIEDSVIKGVIDAMLKSGAKMAKELNTKPPLMYQWHDSYYLGAAHGLTGILYLLLQVPQYLDAAQLEELIRPTVDYLATLRFPSGNYPSSLESQSGDKYVQWCHGAPGFLYLFSQAYKVFQTPSYLELALKAGDVVWERGLLRKGYSICHGVSGNAYCFLELYQTTNDLKHLYRALKFAEWCMDYTKEHEEYAPDRPLSLYEGLAGPMYLLIDIQMPMEAKFPGFTL